MAAKQDLTSSKTAHVMNLLSRGSRSSGSTTQKQQAEPSSGSATVNSSSGAEEKPVAASPASSPAQQQAASAAPVVRTSNGPQVAPIISIMNADAEASASIKAALEATMQDVPGYSEPKPEQAAVPEAAAPAPEDNEDDIHTDHTLNIDSVSGDEHSDTASAIAQNDFPQVEAPQNTQDDAAQASQSTDSGKEASAEPECYPTQNVNIMQLLVQSRLDKYIHMFGLCDCPQCRADVEAIALNNLPAKYVVMPENEISPRLSVFEKRYSTELTAQILRACKEVMDHPRHDMFKNYYNK